MPNHEDHMRITLLVTQGDDGASASAHINNDDALDEALDRIRDIAPYRKSCADAVASGLPTTLKDALRVLNDNPGPGFSLGSHTHVSHDDLPLVPLADFLRVAEALKHLASSARTFRDVPPEDQEWTPLDDAALDNAFTTLDSVAAFIPLARREVA
jgi:hypothetical protein